MTDIYADLANYIRSASPAGFVRAALECRWFEGVIKARRWRISMPLEFLWRASGAWTPHAN